MWQSLHWQALNAPLDYALRKILESFHPSDEIRRLPSVLWGIGSLVAFGALLFRRAGRAAALSASLLLATAPYHLRYSQEVRPYALGLFLLSASLFFLDRYLAANRRPDLVLLYFLSLATLYTLYLAGLILAIAAAALVTEDAFDLEATRRAQARRFLSRSPFFVLALGAGYAPWLPTVLQAIRQPAITTPPGWSPRRIGRFVSYFGFAPGDGFPLRISDLLFGVLLVAGLVLAIRGPRLRFLGVWGVGGVAILEILEHQHSSYDSIFHWLPAGLGLTALAGIALGRLITSPLSIGLRVAVMIGVLWIALDSDVTYFRSGRPDWRPMARFLAATPRSERIFVENQYTQLCLGYYMVGPDWLCCKIAEQREIANLDGELSRLVRAWDRNGNAWLVLAAGPQSEELRSWSRPFPSVPFPSAEAAGGGVVVSLRRAGS
ncbi:MAG TPA: glycosyltransferase family 39 protein [Thermoanaerobaculia bacterium]